MPVERLLLVVTVELFVILAVARLLGVALRAVGQPQVMGEVLGGVLLGPSLLGWVAPGLFAALFPDAALPHLKVLSEYGIDQPTQFGVKTDNEIRLHFEFPETPASALDTRAGRQ